MTIHMDRTLKRRPMETCIPDNGKVATDTDMAQKRSPQEESIQENGKTAIVTVRAPSRMLMETSILEGGKMTILTDRTSSSMAWHVEMWQTAQPCFDAPCKPEQGRWTGKMLADK